MKQEDAVSQVIEHFKKYPEDAEIAFEDICISDELPKFHLATGEVQLTTEQKQELIERYSKEVWPVIRDWKQIRSL